MTDPARGGPAAAAADPARADRRVDPTLVDRRLREVTASLQAATGGAALCRIDGTGGTAKQLEGRMAALLEVRRTLRRDPDDDLTAIAARWRADLAARTERGASAAWLEYLGGGVSELTHLAAATGPTPTTETTEVHP